MTDAELAARCNRTPDGTVINAHLRRARVGWILFALATTATAIASIIAAFSV